MNEIWTSVNYHAYSQLAWYPGRGGGVPGTHCTRMRPRLLHVIDLMEYLGGQCVWTCNVMLFRPPDFGVLKSLHWYYYTVSSLLV